MKLPDEDTREPFVGRRLTSPRAMILGVVVSAILTIGVVSYGVAKSQSRNEPFIPAVVAVCNDSVLVLCNDGTVEKVADDS